MFIHVSLWAFERFPLFDYYEEGWYEPSCVSFYVGMPSFLLSLYLVVALLDHMIFLILFMGLSRQECWSGLLFPSPVYHMLSEFFTVTRLSLVALHGMAHSFIDLGIWKTQKWPQDWKRSVFIPIPKNGNAKECSNYCTIPLISHASKVMLKILQPRLQQYMKRELPDVQVRFRKGRGTRYQIANICWIIGR